MTTPARMRRFIQGQITAYLKANARGHENAVPREFIKAHICYGGGDRHFRELYKGLGVGSSDHGIFWPINAADVEFCRSYWTRIYGHELAREKVNALYAARPELRPATVAVQGNLFEEGRV